MSNDIFHSRPMLALGIVERIAAYGAGIAAYLLLHFWLVWSWPLSAACALSVLGIVAVGRFLIVSAFEVRSLKKRGLPIVDPE